MFLKEKKKKKFWPDHVQRKLRKMDKRKTAVLDLWS